MTARATIDRLMISIHALREEGDGLLMDYYTLADLFQSTPSARRATSDWHESQIFVAISIHALREEGDRCRRWVRCRRRDFNPRPPRGGRLGSSMRGLHSL